MSISRRGFIETAALGSLAVHAAPAAQVDAKTGMPMRVLGRTKTRVSILAFGAGSRFLAYKDEDKAAEALYRALDAGVNYVDSAFNYGKGQSEQWLGRMLKGRRDGVWLVTKIGERNGDEAMRTFEGSLKRFQTDRVDLLHMHGLGDEKDLAAIEAPDGVLKTYYKLRDQKVARFIGVSCHADPVVLKTLLGRHDLDCVQVALNAARMGSGGSRYKGSHPLEDSFETLALPVANRKKMGVTAMKVFAQEKIVGKAPTEQLIRYALSLPIAAAVIGMPKLDHIDENLRVAKAFKPMPQPEMRQLSDRLATTEKAALDLYFRHHIDA